MGKEVVLSMYSSRAMNAQVESPDSLTVISVLLAFQLIFAAAILVMQQLSVVIGHYTAITFQSESLSFAIASSRH